MDLGSLSKLNLLWLKRKLCHRKYPSLYWESLILITLYLAFNSIEGSIPNVLGRLSGLRVFQVWGNNLSRVVPHSLYNISSINIFIVIGVGQFKGAILVTLSNASKLESSDVYDNNFLLSISETYKTSLRLYLAENQLGARAANDLKEFSNLFKQL